jgi:hypothetical protein
MTLSKETSDMTRKDTNLPSSDVTLSNERVDDFEESRSYRSCRRDDLTLLDPPCLGVAINGDRILLLSCEAEGTHINVLLAAALSAR